MCKKGRHREAPTGEEEADAMRQVGSQSSSISGSHSGVSRAIAGDLPE
jgi:hypothetical protein